MLRQGEQVIGFTPYAAHVGGEFAPTGSLSEAVAAYYASVVHPRTGRTDETSESSPAHPLTRSPAQPADPYAAPRAEAAALLRRARAGVMRRLEAMAGDEPAPGEAERLRTSAEWLLALSTEIAAGQTRLEAPLEG